MNTIVSTNPSKNFEVLGEVSVSNDLEIKNAVMKAKVAFTSWSNISLDERIAKVNSFVEISKDKKEDIARIIAKETGRTIKSSRLNVEGGIEYLSAYIGMAKQYLSTEIISETDAQIVKLFHEPRGVVAAILPWNYPFMNVAWQCGQALIAGNTFVYKNSEENPLFSQMLEELIRTSDIPEGVFNVIYGDGMSGDCLVHQNIDMISFTGSTKVGQILTEVAAKKFIPIVTELGGSSPLIIFEDIDITDDLVTFIAGMRLINAGQACDSVKRLIVHESKFNEVVAKLSKYMDSKKIGDASDEETDIGPLISKKQLELIEEQVNDSVKLGAKIVTGAKRPENLLGAYYSPTILINISRNMRVWKEEVFGPVLPIVSFSTQAEAIDLANDTEYGLTAHILTSSKNRFEEVARKINAGSIGHNKTSYWSPLSPFGGYKKSGMGRIHGPFGFYESTQIKVISVEK